MKMVLHLELVKVLRMDMKMGTHSVYDLELLMVLRMDLTMGIGSVYDLVAGLKALRMELGWALGLAKCLGIKKARMTGATKDLTMEFYSVFGLV